MSKILDETLICDVMLPPATIIKRGCDLRTLLVAINQRGKLPPDRRVLRKATIVQQPAAAVPEDLRARCAEILAWQKTGVLKGDALRGYAAAQWYADEHNSLQLAEADTARQAYAMLASAPVVPVQAAIAGEPLPPYEAPAAQEPVAWRYTSSQAFGRKDRRWHYQETFPHAENRSVQEIGLLEPLYAAPPAAEQPDTAHKKLNELDIALKFALCNFDHDGTRRDVKKAQTVLAELRALLGREGEA